eukprot:1513547-Amphidinium_carterae.2
MPTSTTGVQKTLPLSTIDPLYIGTDPTDMHIRALLGVTIGIWELNSWGKADNANTTLRSDHSISTWRTTTTQWHMNTYSSITMLNTKSMTVAFRQWCEDNGPDNGLGHDFNAAMTLHKWSDYDTENALFNIKEIKISDNGWQWSSPITITHTTVTIVKETDNAVVVSTTKMSTLTTLTMS